MKKILNLWVFLLVFSSLVFASGCRKESEEVDVYASIYPVYYLAKNIAGDKLNVKQVYPNGVDVHEYDPVTDGDMKMLLEMAESKMMFYIGSGLEAFIESAKKTVFENAKIKLVELSENMTLYDSVTEEYEKRGENGHSFNCDLHIWLNPVYMQIMADKIYDGLVSIDSENKDYYKSNCEAIKSKLNEIDLAYTEALKDFEFKYMMVDHDAYLYLAKRYGITRIRTRIDNESCDISPAKMIESINKIKELDIKYIVATKNEMVCSSVNSIQSETGIEIVYLDPIATLTSVTADKDYYILMMENLEVLKKIFR